MKTSEWLRNGLESRVEEKLLNRSEGINAIQNLIEELNSQEFNFKMNSGVLDQVLSIAQLNLNQIADRVKNSLAEVMGTARYREYDPKAKNEDWTQSPRYQMTQLLQFLLRKLQVGKRSGDYNQIKNSLGLFVKKQKIDPSLVEHELVSQAMEVIFNVLFGENLSQKKNIQLLALRLLPEEFSLRVIRALER